MKENLENLMSNKRHAKKYLAETFGLDYKKPLLGIFLEKDLSAESKKNLGQFLEACKSLEIEVVVLTGEDSKDNHSGAKTLPYSRKNRSLILDAADIALAFKFNDVQEMLLHGTVPLSSKREEVKDYNPNHETGNAFLFKDETAWAIFASLVRALETFKFPYDWKNIVRQGVESVQV
ncbi:MAG: hypothetical protein WC269_03325 [Candidatus Gracilibacteria bacterium]